MIRVRSNKEMEQANGAMAEMEAPFAAHLRCSADVEGRRALCPRNGRCYLLEATHKRRPALGAKRYRPTWSIEKVAKKSFAYFAHYTDDAEEGRAAEQGDGADERRPGWRRRSHSSPVLCGPSRPGVAIRTRLW